MSKLNCLITERELGTILAALRFLQFAIEQDSEVVPAWAHDVATNHQQFDALGAGEIDQLCETLNFSAAARD